MLTKSHGTKEMVSADKTNTCDGEYDIDICEICGDRIKNNEQFVYETKAYGKYTPMHVCNDCNVDSNVKALSLLSNDKEIMKFKQRLIEIKSDYVERRISLETLIAVLLKDRKVISHESDSRP